MSITSMLCKTIGVVCHYTGLKIFPDFPSSLIPMDDWRNDSDAICKGLGYKNMGEMADKLPFDQAAQTRMLELSAGYIADEIARADFINRGG